MRMRQADYGPGWITSRGLRSIWGFALNLFLILFGFFMLGGGTYVSPSPPYLLLPKRNLGLTEKFAGYMPEHRGQLRCCFDWCFHL